MIPRSRGGSGVANLVAACYACTHSKDDLLPEEWLLSAKFLGEVPHRLLNLAIAPSSGR